ncbi:MAG: ATP-binding protein [Myxococcota bacterium]
MQLGHTQIDFEGLLRVLGENLYSSPTVALRELVQNGHDSCTRRRIEQPDADVNPQIVVRALGDVLEIDDNGAGLTREEIEQYLATVGAGYTRLLRQRSGDTDLIGAFGLGFLSAYVVSDKVEVVTTSFQSPEQTLRFTSLNGQQYTIAVEPDPDRRPVGTTVILHLKEGHRKLGDPEQVHALLSKLCCLLPFPIRAPEPVNAMPPPWRMEMEGWAPARIRQAQLDFAERFEPRFTPIAAWPLASAVAGHSRGLLWIQDGGTYGSSDNRRLVLFVRGMLISEDVRELLPRWAGFIGGVLESDGLTPTASREDVQKDAAFFELQSTLNDALVEGLLTIAHEQPSAWRRVVMRHREALLGAALADPRLFQAMADQLTVPTSEGDLTMTAIHHRSDDAILIGGGLESGPLEVLYRALAKPIVLGHRYAAEAFARQWAAARGQNVLRLGTREGDTAVFPERNDPDKKAALQALLGEPGVDVRLTTFAPSDLPLMRVPDRDAALKKRMDDDEMDRRISTGLLRLARRYTDKIDDSVECWLYVNMNAPTIHKLLSLSGDRQNQLATFLRGLSRVMAPGPGSQNLSGALKEMISVVDDLF